MMQNEIQLLVQITAAHVRATALGLYTTQNSSGVGIGFPVHPPLNNLLIPTSLNRKMERQKKELKLLLFVLLPDPQINFC